MAEDLILIVVIATALAFDFTNGFHDTGNATASSIATGALRPRVAVGLAAILNVVGAFLSLEVAKTIASGIVEAGAVTLTVVFAGLLGAIAWNVITWLMGLPSSSSHALIGGVVGATLAAAGAGAVNGTAVVQKVIVPALLAPIMAGAVAMLAVRLARRLTASASAEHSERGFKRGQIASASLISLAHGTNDAQKTMGIITLALIAHGDIPADDFDVPFWVIVSSAAAIALGTYTGGWRIIRTMGSRIIKMDPAQGFSAQGAGAAVILTASHLGYPLSTTHTISGAVMGAGAAKRLSAVRWGLAGNIVLAWILTLPAAAAIGGVVYGITSVFGSGALGPVLVSLCVVMLIAGLFGRRVQQGPAITADA